MNIKRICSIAVLFIVVCTLQAASFSAKIDGIMYILNSGYAKVGVQDEKLSGDIVIPEKVTYNNTTYTVNSLIEPTQTHIYGGHTSISADNAAFQGCAITSITLPSTITSISNCAFISCKNLKKVVLPSTLKYIGWGSFAYCSSLSDIQLPKGLTSISAWAFGGCSNLKKIELPNGITSLSDAVFKNCGFEDFTIPANITRISSQSLSMSSLKSVRTFIRDITRVNYEESCFANVEQMSLYIPIGTKFIYEEYYPWRGFGNIEEFDDGHSGEIVTPKEIIKKVDGIRYALYEDGTATVIQQDKDELSGDIVIPERLTVGGNEYTVTGLAYPKSTTSNGGLSSISAESAAFQGCAITSITLPSTITSISSCAFISCKNLKKVVLPSTLKDIGWGSFAYCSSLSDIQLPKGLTSMSAWAFGGCSNLKKIELPNGITSLSDAVFKNCGFEDFTIPANITRISSQSLSMSSLKSVRTFIRDITRVNYEESCFANVEQMSLYIPIGTKFIYEEYYPWRGFGNIEEFDDGHSGEIVTPKEIIKKVDGIRYALYEDGTATVIQQDKDELSGDIVIPERLTVGGNEYTVTGLAYPKSTTSNGGLSSISAESAAFQGCAITSITLPSTITSISSCAFISCKNLKKVVLPSTLKDIGWGSFAYCSSLSDIQLPEGLTYISAWAFGGCSNLKKIELPNGITSLPDAVFSGCQLESIILPKSLIRLADKCLDMQSLKKVTVLSDAENVICSTYAFGNYSNIQNTVLYVEFGKRSDFAHIYPWMMFASIEEIDTNTGISVSYLDWQKETEIFDMNGIKKQNTQIPGLYIVGGKKVLVTK